MLLDDYVLEELGHGAGAVNQIEERLSRRILDALERLRKGATSSEMTT
jgi:hypothetical protein